GGWNCSDDALGQNIDLRGRHLGSYVFEIGLRYPRFRIGFQQIGEYKSGGGPAREIYAGLDQHLLFPKTPGTSYHAGHDGRIAKVISYGDMGWIYQVRIFLRRIEIERYQGRQVFRSREAMKQLSCRTPYKRTGIFQGLPAISPEIGR